MLYPAIKAIPLTGSEPIHSGSKALGRTVLDFWKWSSPDLVNNAARGILAEYLVACALGVTDRGRVEWDAYDLVTNEGIKVEVKSAAYLQSWAHAKLSSIRFSIGKTIGWKTETNTYDVERKRQADVYVFCLFHHQDKATLDPLDLDQWTFYILPTSALDSLHSNRATLSLSRLMAAGAQPLKYEAIALGIVSCGTSA